MDVSNIVNKQQYEIIKESTTNKLESRVSLIKLLNHGMHVDDKINDEVENVKSILKSLGDWPILMGAKWNEGNFDPIKLSLLLNKIGVDYAFFFEFEVRTNPIKTHSNVLSFAFQEPLMINPKTYYTIVSIIRLMNNNTQVIEENKKAYEDFFKLILQDPNNSHYLNFITLEKLNSLTGINWVSYVQLLLDNTNVNLDGNEKILFSSNKFVTFLSIFSQTSKRMQANFFFFSIINWMYQYLPNLRYRFQRQMPQISDCVEIVAKSLPLRMNSLYVERFFDTKTKTKVEQMVEEIRSEFLKILQTADWLDNSTKKNAIDKLVAMKTCIGYPEELLQDKVLERYYQSLNVDYNSYLNAILSINAFEKSNHFKGLREPAKNCYWIDNSKDVTMVNAAYHIPGNTIKIPAAFLQDVIFDENRPNYVNYAVAGMVVGHEMTHGFDDKGGEFDKDGNYVNWWSNETTLTFKRKSECIINQYQQYIDPRLNINVNGLLTLGENIADNGGLKQSFLAYNNWVKQNGHEKKLPGLNYTIPQMFWIAFAQFWCSQDSYGAALSRILNDVHAPSRFRVIGTLSNIDDFASDFNCPIGSPMNPKKKCKVW
ncbi:hypothetical protein FQR65_LT17765 [Abscondita terminalis]|nr:hypothetical protein FQR65_LT17765 [Abscondita terminalis]